MQPIVTRIDVDVENIYERRPMPLYRLILPRYDIISISC